MTKTCETCKSDCKAEEACGFYEKGEVKPAPLYGTPFTLSEPTIHFDGIQAQDGGIIYFDTEAQTPRQLTPGEGWAIPSFETMVSREPTISSREERIEAVGEMASNGELVIPEPEGGIVFRDSGSLSYPDIIEATGVLREDGYELPQSRPDSGVEYHRVAYEQELRRQGREAPRDRNVSYPGVSHDEARRTLRTDEIREAFEGAQVGIPQMGDFIDELNASSRREQRRTQQESVHVIIDELAGEQIREFQRDYIAEVIALADDMEEQYYMDLVEPATFRRDDALSCVLTGMDAMSNRHGRPPYAMILHPEDYVCIAREIDPRFQYDMNTRNMVCLGVQIISNQRVPEGQIWMVRQPPRYRHTPPDPIILNNINANRGRGGVDEG